MKITIQTSRGISLVDLMMALAMAAVVLSAYTTFAFRSVESNVTEALVHSAAAMNAVEQTCASDPQAVVNDNLDANYYYVPSRTDDDFIDRITIGADCANRMMVVVVWTAATGARVNPILEFSLSDATGGTWHCHLIDGDPRQVPEFCRFSYFSTSG